MNITAEHFIIYVYHTYFAACFECVLIAFCNPLFAKLYILKCACNCTPFVSMAWRQYIITLEMNLGWALAELTLVCSAHFLCLDVRLSTQELADSNNIKCLLHKRFGHTTVKCIDSILI